MSDGACAEQVPMKTFQGGRQEVPITAEHGLDRTAQTIVGEAQVRATNAWCGQTVPVVVNHCGFCLQMFKDWVADVDRDPRLFVDEIHLQSVDMFGPPGTERVGFVKFKSIARVVSSGRDSGVIDVPGIVFMRGGAVGMLVILECDGIEYTILTRQARVPIGKHDLPEIPAGMLDGSGNFKGVAAEEIQQECDIVITEDELVDLTRLAYGNKFRGIIPSAGGCDEYVKLYTVRRSVDQAVLSKLQGRLTGVLEEGEHIKLQIVELKDAWNSTPDVKALCALTLYQQLRATGRLPDRAKPAGASSPVRRVTSVDDLESAQAVTSLVRYGRLYSNQSGTSTQLMLAEEAAALHEASAPPPGPSAQVTMRSMSGALVEVPITAAPGMDATVVVKSSVFKSWVAEVDSDPVLFIESIHIQSVDMFGPRVGFVKFKTTAKAQIGHQKVIDVPGIVFMRGGAVGILVILECDGIEYTILTRQARVPIGKHDLPEIPAGMLDGSGNFAGVAAEEIQQECNITIQENELVDLTQLAYGDNFSGVVPSAGGCDEFIKLYMVSRQVDKAVLRELQGRLTGLLSEGEFIKLQIIELSKLWETSPDAKALSALALREYLKLHQMLPDSRRRVLSVKELSHDGADEDFRGGRFQDGHSGTTSQSLKHVRMSQAWSMTSVDSEIVQSETGEQPAALPSANHSSNSSYDSVTGSAPAEPTHVRQAKRERGRRRSVSFGHEGAAMNRAAMQGMASAMLGMAPQNEGQQERRPSVSFNTSNDALQPPAVAATRTSSTSGPSSPSPRSALRRGSMQGRLKQHQTPANVTVDGSASSTGRFDPPAPNGPGHLHESVSSSHLPIRHVETKPWVPALSPNPLDHDAPTSLAAAPDSHASSDEDHANMSADEDEVDRLMMDDLLEATGALPSGAGGSGRDVVVKVKLVHEPPTYLAALYAKADASNQVQLVLMVLTIIALFGDDFRL
eukprot:COSAG02_NODE_647_length_18944_cov_60.450199_4_plen_964_part_01